MNGIPEMHGINVDKWHEMPLYRSRCLEVVQVFSLPQVFSYDFFEIFKNTIFFRTILVAASVFIKVQTRP